MAKLSAQEFIEAIKEMTVLELNDLVKACEEEFGVSAAAVYEYDLYGRILNTYTVGGTPGALFADR